MTKKYKVLVSRDLRDLELAVKYHINNGWVCVGGIAVYNETYYQAIIKN